MNQTLSTRTLIGPQGVLSPTIFSKSFGSPWSTGSQGGSTTTYGWGSASSAGIGRPLVVLPQEWVDYYTCRHWPRFTRKFIYCLIKWYRHDWKYKGKATLLGVPSIFSRLFTDEEAGAVCKFFAEAQKKRELPLLMGISSVMDRVLLQLFKECA